MSSKPSNKAPDIQSIDWNQMSELGLIERINREILHPVGLAMSREVETGESKKILISDDGEWEYASSVAAGLVLTKQQIHAKLRDMGYLVEV